MKSLHRSHPQWSTASPVICHCNPINSNQPAHHGDYFQTNRWFKPVENGFGQRRLKPEWRILKSSYLLHFHAAGPSQQSFMTVLKLQQKTAGSFILNRQKLDIFTNVTSLWLLKGSNQIFFLVTQHCGGKGKLWSASNCLVPMKSLPQ